MEFTGRQQLALTLVTLVLLAVGVASALQPGPLDEGAYKGVGVGIAGAAIGVLLGLNSLYEALRKRGKVAP